MKVGPYGPLHAWWVVGGYLLKGWEIKCKKTVVVGDRWGSLHMMRWE